MEFGMDVAEPVGGDMGVDFGGVDGGVAEEFLNDAKVGAIFEEVRGKAMAQHMRGDVALDASHSDAPFDAQPQRHGGKRRAALCQKDIRGRTPRDETWAA